MLFYAVTPIVARFRKYHLKRCDPREVTALFSVYFCTSPSKPRRSEALTEIHARTEARRTAASGVTGY